MKKITLIFATSMVLTGCVQPKSTEEILSGMYNISSVEQSEFDGSRHVRVSNVHCSGVSLELYQNSQQAKSGFVLLKAGTGEIKNIGDGQSLNFNLDNKIHKFKTNDISTNHQTVHLPHNVTRNFSYKTYIVPESFIRDAAKADKLVARISFLNKQYVEGNCMPTDIEEYKKQNPTAEIYEDEVRIMNKFSAQNAFEKFIKLIDSE